MLRIKTSTMERALAIFLLLLFAFLQYGPPAAALSDSQLQIFQNNIHYFDADVCSSSAPASPQNNQVFILGDSVMRGAYYEYGGPLNKTFNEAGISATVDAQTSRSIEKIKGQDINPVNQQKTTGLEALQNDKDKISAAGKIVIELGTNTDGDPATYKQSLIDLIQGKGSTKGIQDYNSSAQIYIVNIFSPSIADRVARNNVIDQVAGQDGATVIDTTQANIDVGADNTHPTFPKGYAAYDSVVVGALGTSPDNANVGVASCCSGGATTIASDAAPKTAAPNANQIANTKIIMGIAKTDGLDKNAALIGLMVALAESHITILANSNVPVSESNPAKQGDGSNYDSVGIFQQRPSTSWSTYAPNGGNAADSNKDAVWQLMDPAYSAEAFFGSPPSSKAVGPLSKGLMNKQGWESMPPWVAAQAVQASGTASGSNYQKQQAAAQSLIDKYWDSAAPVALPVPLSGSAQGGGSDNIGSSCAGAVDQATGDCPVTAPVWGSVNGNGNEYSLEQFKKIFGDPGTSAADNASMLKNLVWVDFNGHSVQVNKKVAPCLKAVAADIKAANINYTIKEMGCYRFDSNNGVSNIGLKSYHTYGAACDINWDSNPFSASGANVSHDMPQQYIQIFHSHGFTWGGDWQSPKDFMHFEFNGIKP